jgi:tetratricopeptide (TPR) repeat protein
MGYKTIVLVAGVAIGVGLAACAEGDQGASPFTPVMKNFSSPHIPITSHERGKQLLEVGQLILALEQFHVALVDNPRSVDVLNALGVTYDQLARSEISEQYYRRALLIAPSSPQTLNNLGYSYMLQGRRAEAARLFQRAMAIDPTNVAAQANLARLDAGPAPGAALQRDRLVAAAATPARAPGVVAARNGAPPSAELQIVRQSPTVQVLVMYAPPMLAAAAPAEDDLPLLTPPSSEEAASPRSARPAPRNLKELSTARTPIAVPNSVTVEPPRLVATEERTAILQYVAYVPSADRVRPAIARDRGLRAAEIDVSNGAGRRFMAARMSAWLATQGAGRTRLSNDETFANRRSVIYFRGGFRDEAEDLQRLLPPDILIRVAPDGQRTPLRLKLGGDLLAFDRMLIVRLNHQRWS